MGIFLQFVRKGLNRRKKEMRFVSLVTFIAVFFMSSIALFQTIMDRYLMETNYQNYGDWVLSAVKDYRDFSVLFSELKHPYFQASGVCETGGELLDQNDEPSGVYIGTADDTVREFGHITLYEGEFPEADDEVAMDLSSLSILGYSYELGQTIRIAVREEDEIVEKEMKLTGTVKSFAANWMYAWGYGLPNCLVTEAGMEQIGAPLFATYFYQLDRAYENLDMEEFTAAFLKPGNVRMYNSYVYENRVWGSKKMFDAVKLLLLFIGALAVGYLMLSYVSQRRRWYYKLRCAGADKRQLKVMILAEAFYGAFPYAFLGVIAPYAAGAAICYGIAARMRISYFFVFSVRDFLGQMGVAFGMILFVVLCAWMGVRDKRLGQNSAAVTKRQIRRLRRDAGKERNVARIFVRRQRKLYPFRRAASVLFSFAVCFLLTLCLNKIYQASAQYAQIREYCHDYMASKQYKFEKLVKFKDEGYAGGENPYDDMYEGIDENIQQEIASLIGIERISWQIRDETHILQWEHKLDSPIEQKVREVYENNGSYLPITKFQYYEPGDEILNEARKDFELDGLDEEAFWNGDEVILMLTNEGGFGYTAFDGESVHETTIHPGDMVEIVSAEEELYVPLEMKGHDKLPGRTTVKVGAVIYNSLMKWKDRFDVLCDYGVIGSQKLAERVAKADQKTLNRNFLNVDLNLNQSFESTQKRLVSIFNQNGMIYRSNSEELVHARDQYIRELCIYGSLFCAILVIFLLLEVHFQGLWHQYRMREYRMLRQLGMKERDFFWMSVKESLGEAIFMLFSIPFSYGVLVWGFYLGYRKKQETIGVIQWSDSVGDYTADIRRLAWDDLCAFAQPWHMFAFIMFLILLLVGISCLSAKKNRKM